MSLNSTLKWSEYEISCYGHLPQFKKKKANTRAKNTQSSRQIRPYGNNEDSGIACKIEFYTGAIFLGSYDG